MINNEYTISEAVEKAVEETKKERKKYGQGNIEITKVYENTAHIVQKDGTACATLFSKLYKYGLAPMHVIASGDKKTFSIGFLKEKNFVEKQECEECGHTTERKEHFGLEKVKYG